MRKISRSVEASLPPPNLLKTCGQFGNTKEEQQQEQGKGGGGSFGVISFVKLQNDS